MDPDFNHLTAQKLMHRGRISCRAGRILCRRQKQSDMIFCELFGVYAELTTLCNSYIICGYLSLFIFISGTEKNMSYKWRSLFLFLLAISSTSAVPVYFLLLMQVQTVDREHHDTKPRQLCCLLGTSAICSLDFCLFYLALPQQF